MSADRTAGTAEANARGLKAAAIAATLRQVGCTAADAALLDEAGRRTAADAAGQREPSEQTWRVVLGLMVEAEAQDDPFRGLPR